jgi:hypothetical protein
MESPSWAVKEVFCTMKKKIFALTLAIIMLLGVNVSAAVSFSDVPSSHWAHSSISRMASLGFILGDASNRYYPDFLVDKFYVAKVIAQAAGYKATGSTEAEKTFQDLALQKHSQAIAGISNSFARWDSTANREISYLLEKQILTQADINGFVTRNNGIETVQRISKEELAVYLVRLMGATQTAVSAAPSSRNLFADDAQISAAAKPHVYYLRANGLIAGDSNNRFNPKSQISKAVFAVMLNSAHTAMQSPPLGVGTVISVSGTIAEVYPELNTVQVQDTTGNRRIHPVASGTIITIDGFVRALSDLKGGMTFTGVLVNEQLSNIQAVSTSAPAVQATVPAAAPQNLSQIEGLVSGISVPTGTISIELRMLSPVGSIFSETRTYSLSSGCKITKGAEVVPLTDIAAGDIVSLKVSGSTVYEIDARLAEMNFAGTLTEKRTNEQTNYYIITDAQGRTYDLIVNDLTIIERGSDTGLRFNDLKMGDAVQVKTNYNVITFIKGEGIRTNTEGFVRQIHIFENHRATIIFEDSLTRQLGEFPISSTLVDVYSMRIGDKLRLRLDSLEVDSFTKLENAATQNITGRITALRSDNFVLTPANSNVGTTIFFGGDTYVYDTIARKSSSPANLAQNMELFVTYRTGANNHASSITILSNR